MRGPRTHLALILSLLAAAGCSAAEPPRPPILLLTLDTTRADRLGCYGYFRDTTPNLDGLAEAGVLFENAYAPIATTLPSHLSLVTGAYPGRHGVRGNLSQFSRDTVDAMATLPELLRGEGYATAAVVAAAPLRAETGIDAGFDSFSEPPLDRRSAAEVVDAALAWLDGRPDGPFLLWAHFFDPHTPHDPPAAYRQLFSDQEARFRRYLEHKGHGRGAKIVERNNGYDRELRYMDAEIGRLLAGLEARGLFDALAIVVVGDHGEGLGQHGWLLHGRIHEEQLRVPLILKLPAGLGPRGKRVAEVASLIDVAPTLVALLDLELPRAVRDQLQGVDLLAGTTRPYVFAERDHRNLNPKHKRWREGAESAWEPGNKYALIGAEWKYVHLSDWPDRLFHLAEDPGESRDVIAEHPEVAARMRERVQEILAEHEAARPGFDVEREVDPQRLDELRRLGYVE